MKSGIAVLPLLALLLALVNPVAVHATSNDLVQAQSLGVYSPAHLFSTTDAALAAGEYNGILDEAWKWIKRFFNRYLDYNVEMVALEYRTHQADGSEITVSGLCIFPCVTNEHPHEVSLPALSMQHPTQVERRYSPSICQLMDPELTVPVAACIAASGYMVFLADYPGMGTNMNVHPYCQNSLANSVVDMITTGLDYARGQTNAPYPSWNSELYLMGYSEGGYATMITAKAIQQQSNAQLTVTAAAPLDGPYSLSSAMRTLMVNADTNYSAPYFLPYVANGYDSVYATQYVEYIFASNVIQSIPGDPQFGPVLRNMVTAGTNTSSEINQQMMKVDPYVGPRSILTESFIANLTKTSGVVYDVLEANNGYQDWTPMMPMKMMHNRDDDLVPFDNATNAMGVFSQTTAPAVSLDAFSNSDYPLIYLLAPLIGSVHSATAPFAYIRGFKWIDSMAHSNRCAGQASYYDADNDLVADLSVYWPEEGMWYTRGSVLNEVSTRQLGWADAVPVAADYDGDGKADVAVYWPRQGEWYMALSGSEAVQSHSWGWPGAIPVPADYDGDRKADMAVYWPEWGTWYIWRSSDGESQILPWGWAGALPVPADYTGDGMADPAVYWPEEGMWYIFDAPLLAVKTFQWGWADAMPVPMHMDNDREADLAVYWPAGGMWYIRGSENGTIHMRQWGWAGAAPVPADYDGDGYDDLAVYGQQDGTWYILNSANDSTTTREWGWDATLPVNNQLRINQCFFPMR